MYVGRSESEDRRCNNRSDPEIAPQPNAANPEDAQCEICHGNLELKGISRWPANVRCNLIGGKGMPKKGEQAWNPDKNGKQPQEDNRYHPAGGARLFVEVEMDAHSCYGNHQKNEWIHVIFPL
jgi:hypothetical protein